MATPSINQRIVLTGAEEVKRHLEQIGQAGDRAGNQTRAALAAATGPLNSFSIGASGAARSSGQLRGALQGLSFQVNDVATSLASGARPMQVFAQQGGQIFQVFQQGGGAKAVLGGAATAIRGMITPMTAATAAAVALAGGLALVVSRAASTQDAARQFDVILRGVGKTGQTTGTDLAKAAQNLRDVGLNTEDATKALQDAIRNGVRPEDAERIVRIAADLKSVLGEGAFDQFIKSAGSDTEALSKLAVQLGVISKETAQWSVETAKAGAVTSINAQLIRQMGDRVRGSANDIGAAAQAMRTLGVAWNDMLNALAQSSAVQAAVVALQGLAGVVTALAKGEGMSTLGSVFVFLANAATPLKAGIDAVSNSILFLGRNWETVTTTVQGLIGGLLGWLQRLIDAALEAARAIGNVFGGGGGGAPIATAPIPAFAGGGMVRGPGTGRSDSIFARLSNGEFVMPALPTKMFLPQLEAMRSMMAGPIMPRTRIPRGFANGGLVAAGGGSPIYLTFPSGATVGPMMADRQVRQAMEREGRRAAMLSAGKVPSTA